MPKATRVRAVRAVLSLMVLVAPVIQETAAACSCGGPNPPCAAAWHADAVFIGLVIDRRTERIGGTISWTVYKIAVSQTLRGSVDPFITIVSNSRPDAKQIEASKSRAEQSEWMNTCDFRFEVGQQYVIYANRTAEGEWATSSCSGTKLVEHAAADLEYFATLSFADPSGRVYGTVERTIADPAHPSEVKGVPAGGVTVTLVSEVNRLTVKTDAEGKLDVQVPAGEYTVAPAVPPTIRVYGSAGRGNRVSVPSRGCAPVHFSLISNGRIEGRVVHADGSAVQRISVHVIPVDLRNQSEMNGTIVNSQSTDEKGRFAVEAILPGHYVLGVNARWGPRLDAPYLASYFPNGAREGAQVIEIGEGERKTGFTMVLNRLTETTISGTVFTEDEQPMANAQVRIEAAGYEGTVTDSATTEANGAFQLRALMGVSYVIRARAGSGNGFRESQTAVLVDEMKEGLRLIVPR